MRQDRSRVGRPGPDLREKVVGWARGAPSPSSPHPTFGVNRLKIEESDAEELKWNDRRLLLDSGKTQPLTGDTLRV